MMMSLHVYVGLYSSVMMVSLLHDMWVCTAVL